MNHKEIKIMQQILNFNDRIANEIRSEMGKKGIVYINLMSSPGSGKTRLLEKTAETLKEHIFVIEGDIHTTLDAERLAKAGIGVYQINTGPFGGDCHLEAGWIRSALEEIDLENMKYLFVENIGNLVCPAEFDIGAHVNVVVLSVAEGEDKPLKYPLAFRNSQLCLIAKTDLLPYLDLDLDTMKANMKKINPHIKIIELSSNTGQGFAAWLDFLTGYKI
ncbi:MAG: hydrogenase nickel incorporation protein HypB [Candidatus Cloacimonadaceae bacterium]|nr:hydrogenase nickel incorporation protein HypB [Candidatus Cloacimonadaceae bacterium]MDP3113420.1 hydrogenase nickel incorporation protein HypB [Candidatus Cloacimonadaceae bacterium]